MNRRRAIERIQHAAGFDEHDDLALTLVQAEDVLDAILPQVTTVEELEALPDGTKVLDESGDVWRKGSHWFFGTTTGASCTAGWLALRPLTVVWQPS